MAGKRDQHFGCHTRRVAECLEPIRVANDTRSAAAENATFWKGMQAREKGKHVYIKEERRLK